MNDQTKGVQRPSLRGGDGSSHVYFHQHPSTMMLVPTLDAFVSPCVPFNAHANTAVVDLPCHSPEEMTLLVGKVHSVTKQEQLFPLILHKHRTNIDKLTMETTTNYSELMKLVRADVEKTKDTTTIELLSLLQREFDALAMLATNSEATMSKNFDDYKNMLYDQFSKVLTLERANLHNALAIWRDRFQHDQQKTLNQQLKISQDVATSKQDLITNLQQQVSKFSMRLGLALAEKKETEGKICEYEKSIAGREQLVASHEQAMSELRRTNEQMLAKHEQAMSNLRVANEQAISDLQHAHDAKIVGMRENDALLVRQVQEYQQQVHQLRSKAIDLDTAHYQLQKEHEECADPTEVQEVLDQLDQMVEELATLKKEKDALKKKHQTFQNEHQFCAEHADRLKNLPDIYELRAEVFQLKQENARISKKNEEGKPERVSSTQVDDSFAGLAIENGLTPRVADLRHRYQTQKLQTQLTASATRNDELTEHIKALQTTNSSLEATIRDSEAITSHATSSHLISETSGLSDAITQELSDLSALVVDLDDKNVALEEALSEYQSNPVETRIQRLQGQLEIYKQLLTKDRSGPRETLNLLSGTQMQKLVKSGLHRHNPTRQFVSETYYIYSQIVKERMEKKVRQDASQQASSFGLDTAVDKAKAYTPVEGEQISPKGSEITWKPNFMD
ncbi:hypothetical protein E2P81_ATG06449 [Venturia nashicola]|uniref:Uncharacterized protein n=1 Tax=Venturia nashicola TaxID=86259 RepID=A0A4Z1P8S0_9PEZI|nr:hypothetical protein E6O75_ATG06610 [Venturia nashicola]TLD28103.1 hypothetical protein E2P81_ATG06449 [Venturia nashicola]